MTPEYSPTEHKTRAEYLLGHAETCTVGNPYRADNIARATVHALLALQPAPPVSSDMWSKSQATLLDYYAAEDAAAMKPIPRKRAASVAEYLAASDAVGDESPGVTENAAPKPTPRKRAPKKTTTPKETTS